MVRNWLANAGDVRDVSLIPEDPWEDPLEEKMAAYCSIPAWRTPGWRRSLEGYSPQGCKESDMAEVT